MEFEEANDVYGSHDDIDEDIKLLKTVLQDGDNEDDSESDGELLVLDKNEDEYVSVASQSRPSTSTDYTVSSFPTTSMGTDADDLVYRIDHSSINAETCLAMNRAYQEVLLDTLRQIEMSLSENRLKQRELSESLDEKCKKPINKDTNKADKFVLNTPFFSIGDQIPPMNQDVQLKINLQDEKQHVKPRTGWPKRSRTLLLNAIKVDALEQLLKPILNRLEVESSKLIDCKNADEIAKSKEKIEAYRAEIKEKQQTPAEKLLKEVNTDRIDFLKISALDFDSKYSALECEAIWRNVLHPSINKEAWTQEEDEKLIQLVEENHLRNWKDIAEKLGTNRTPFQCLQHFQMNSIVYDTSEWKPEEDELLTEVVETCKYGTGKVQWSQVAYYMDMRSASQCMGRWRKINPEAKHGKWGNKEDCLLISAVEKYGIVNWSRISENVPGRTSIQCRDRYLNSICLCNNPWNYEEDKKLLKLYDKHKNFATVALYMERRTESYLERRYNKLRHWGEEWNKFCKIPREKQVEMMSLNFVLSQDGEIVSLKGLPIWVKQEIARGKSAEEVAKEEKILKKHFHKRNSYRRLEEANWLGYAKNEEINEEDYFKQEQDRLQGDVIVPRPPPVKVNFRTNEMTDERMRLAQRIESHIEKIIQKSQLDKELEKPDTLLGKIGTTLKPMLDKESREKFAEEKAQELINTIEAQGKTVRNVKVKNILDNIRFNINNELIDLKKGEGLVTSDKKKKKRMRKEIWQEGYSSDEGKGEKMDSDSEKEIDEEEEEEECVKSQLLRVQEKAVTEAESLRRQKKREKLNKHKFASDMLREAILAKLPSLNPVGRKKVFHMFPRSVMEKSRLLREEDQDRQKRKCLALLMKSFDVATADIYKNARELKRKNAARAMLMSAIPMGKTRGSRSKATQPSLDNDKIESADLVLEMKPELGLPEEENDDVGQGGINKAKQSGVNSNESGENSDDVSGCIGRKIKVEDEGNDQLYEEYNKSLVYIPPNLSNMRGTKNLLLEHRCLVDKAGPYFDKDELRDRLYSMKSKGPNLLMNVIGAVGYRTKKNLKLKGESKIKSNLPLKDVIKHVRKTRSYQQLKARFQAAFSWPALMATIKPPTNDATVPEYISKLREEKRRQAQNTTVEQPGTSQNLGNDQGTSTMESDQEEGTSHRMEEDEEDQNEDESLSLDESIQQVILMSGDDYKDTGIEEEAINKLVNKIMNVYRARRMKKKRGKVAGQVKNRKKLSPAMAASVTQREKTKLLKRLNLYDKYMQIQKNKPESERNKSPEPLPDPAPTPFRKPGRPKGAKNFYHIQTLERTRKSSRQDTLRAKAQQMEVYEQCGSSPKAPISSLNQSQDPYIYTKEEFKMLKKMTAYKKRKPKETVTINPKEVVVKTEISEMPTETKKTELAIEKIIKKKPKASATTKTGTDAPETMETDSSASSPLVVTVGPPGAKRKGWMSEEIIPSKKQKIVGKSGEITRSQMSEVNIQSKQQNIVQSNEATSSGSSINRSLMYEKLKKKIYDSKQTQQSVSIPNTCNNITEESEIVLTVVKGQVLPESQRRDTKDAESSPGHVTLNPVRQWTSITNSGGKDTENHPVKTGPELAASRLSSAVNTQTISQIDKSALLDNSAAKKMDVSIGTKSFQTKPLSVSKSVSSSPITVEKGQEKCVSLLKSKDNVSKYPVTKTSEPVSVKSVTMYKQIAPKVAVNTPAKSADPSSSGMIVGATNEKAVTIPTQTIPEAHASGCDTSKGKVMTPMVIGVPVMIGETQQTAWLPVFPGKDGKLLRDKDGKIVVPESVGTIKQPTLEKQ